MKNIQHKEVAPEIFNLKGWIPSVNQLFLEKEFTQLLKDSGFTIIDFKSYQFPVKGFTAYWLLAESHLAIHSFYEDQYSYIELSSCNLKKAEIFLTLSKEGKYNIKWDQSLTKSMAPCLTN